MFLTICIPTYNRSHTIIRTLESLVQQSYKNFEVLIIDDGSTDETEIIVTKYLKNQAKDFSHFKYFKKENGGKYTAINKALDLAQGEYFLILDSDDWLTKTTVEKLFQINKKIEGNYYSGIIGKCSNQNGEILGANFKEKEISYIDMHFPMKGYKSYSDCCEINRTEILREYKFPIKSTIKFIPEAYLFDQVGINYKLYCTNEILKIVEYQDDGITLNTNFKKNNIEGYLINYKMRIEKIIPSLQNRKYYFEVIAWWRFWDAYKQVNQVEYFPSNINFVGRAVKLLHPFINFYYKKTQKNLYQRGR